VRRVVDSGTCHVVRGLRECGDSRRDVPCVNHQGEAVCGTRHSRPRWPRVHWGSCRHPRRRSPTGAETPAMHQDRSGRQPTARTFGASYRRTSLPAAARSQNLLHRSAAQLVRRTVTTSGSPRASSATADSLCRGPAAVTPDQGTTAAAAALRALARRRDVSGCGHGGRGFEIPSATPCWCARPESASAILVARRPLTRDRFAAAAPVSPQQPVLL